MSENKANNGKTRIWTAGPRHVVEHIASVGDEAGVAGLAGLDAKRLQLTVERSALAVDLERAILEASNENAPDRVIARAADAEEIVHAVAELQWLVAWMRSRPSKVERMTRLFPDANPTVVFDLRPDPSQPHPFVWEWAQWGPATFTLVERWDGESFAQFASAVQQCLTAETNPIARIDGVPSLLLRFDPGRVIEVPGGEADGGHPEKIRVFRCWWMPHVPMRAPIPVLWMLEAMRERLQEDARGALEARRGRLHEGDLTRPAASDT